MRLEFFKLAGARIASTCSETLAATLMTLCIGVVIWRQTELHKLLLFLSENRDDDVGRLCEGVGVDDYGEEEELVHGHRLEAAAADSLPILRPSHCHRDVVSAHAVLDIRKLTHEALVGLEAARIEHEAHTSYKVELVFGAEDSRSELVDVNEFTATETLLIIFRIQNCETVILSRCQSGNASFTRIGLAKD